jgi:crotonobetainyl-CoA:carnitine CoA-transferase CaiB-like acyl-CoA transferase
MMNIDALTGVRILDLSRLLPGPFCSMMLGDLGAEVIKIEEPGVGDYVRHIPPFYKKESVYFLAVNRNKKSLTLNLKDQRGKDIFLDLVKTSDVVLEGFRPGVMDKLDIGYKTLSEINPGIVVCSISGYGQDGPYAMRAGHDVNYLSIAGIMGFTGTRAGTPIIPGVQIADIGGGALLAASCIMAALIARHTTGKGQHVDVSMMDGALSWLSMHAGKYFCDAMNPNPSSEMLTGRFACYNIYKTKDDRYMSLGAVEPQFWAAFCTAVDREDLIPEQYTPGERAPEVIEEIQRIFAGRTKEEWVHLLKDVDCCCEPVNTFTEAFSHPQVLSRQMIVELDHPTEGHIRQINFPGKLSGTPPRIRTAPPALGMHTEEILKGLGLEEKEISVLRDEHIV